MWVCIPAVPPNSPLKLNTHARYTGLSLVELPAPKPYLTLKCIRPFSHNPPQCLEAVLDAFASDKLAGSSGAASEKGKTAGAQESVRTRKESQMGTYVCVCVCVCVC